MERLIDKIGVLRSNINFTKLKVTKDFCKQYAKIFWTFDIPSYDNIDDFTDIVYEYLITTKNRKDFYYENYLTSKHWYNFKKSIHIENCKCEFCGKTTNLNVHHLDYDYLFHENSRCVVVLCRDCHSKLHQMQKTCRNLIAEDLERIKQQTVRNKKMIAFCQNAFRNKLSYDNTTIFSTDILDKIIPIVSDFLQGCNTVSSSIIRYIMPLENITPLDTAWYSAYTGKLRQCRIKKGYKQSNKGKTFSITRYFENLIYNYCGLLEKGGLVVSEKRDYDGRKKTFVDKINILFERMQAYLLDFTNKSI